MVLEEKERVSVPRNQGLKLYPHVVGHLSMSHESGPRKLQQLGAPMSLYRQLKALCFHKAAFLLAVTQKEIFKAQRSKHTTYSETWV